MKGNFIAGIINGIIIAVIIGAAAFIFILRNQPIYIHPDCNTVYIGEDDELKTQFDLNNKFCFSPSNPLRNELAEHLKLEEPLKDDEFLCCAVGHIITDGFYRWPATGGATGTRGTMLLWEIAEEPTAIHIVKFRWPKNGFILPYPSSKIDKSHIDRFLHYEN